MFAKDSKDRKEVQGAASETASQNRLQQAPARRFPRWRRRLLVLLIAACVLFATLFFFRVPILTGLARAWTVNESLTKADAIVVLGGGIYTRPFEAARLYSAGYAKHVLIMNVMASPTDKLGITLPEPELTQGILMRKGVPIDAVQVIGTNVSNTAEEALAVADWAKRTGAKSVVISTDLFPTRRVRWIFRKTLNRVGVQVAVQAHNASRYSANNWWRREEGLITFQDEVIKYVYYRLKY